MESTQKEEVKFSLLTSLVPELSKWIDETTKAEMSKVIFTQRQ